jgi:hypothetical protein
MGIKPELIAFAAEVCEPRRKQLCGAASSDIKRSRPEIVRIANASRQR